MINEEGRIMFSGQKSRILGEMSHDPPPGEYLSEPLEVLNDSPQRL
jgi:hypothetical protein